MSKRTRSNRLEPTNMVESLNESAASMTVEDRPITKKSYASKTRKIRDNPGTEYVSNIQIEDCESDSDGPKGKVFANFVYNKLKNINSMSIEEAGEAVPKIYIMVGPPGAGKSTIKRNFNIINYVNIDLDEIKKLLVKCFPNDRSIYGFGIIHHLKRLAKYMLETAISENINILFDTTGRMKDMMTDVINSTNSASYEQYIIIISTSLENCLHRAEMRNRIEADREPMTPEMVQGSYESFMDPSRDKGTLSYYLIGNPTLFSNARELYIFDNNSSSPRLIFKKVGENVEVAENYPNFYNMEITESPPYFVMKHSGGRKARKTRKHKNNKKRITRKYR